MSGFVGRLGTKINYATGRAEKTELDETTALMISRFDNFIEDCNALKAKIVEHVHYSSTLAKQEKLAEALAQMSARVKNENLKRDAATLAESMRQIGKRERDMAPLITETIVQPMENFLKQPAVEYKTAKSELDKARIEMDGFRSKRQRSSSPDAAVKEQLQRDESDAKANFEQKLEKLHGVANQLPEHLKSQDDMNIAYCRELLKFFETLEERLNDYLNS